MFQSLAFVGLVLLQGVAVWFAWRAVTSARTSQGAVGWVAFLIFVPYLGVPLYLFLGHHKYKSYIIGRRDSASVIEGVRAYREANVPLEPPAFPIKPLEEIAELPVLRGNDLKILIDGAQTFDAIFKALDAAKDYILIQFYIIHDDELGRALQQRLLAAAARGVTIRMMFDGVGSNGLPDKYHEDLSAAGVQVLNPKSARGPKNRFQLNFRNHRKTVVVDGLIGFTGGLNVGDEYMGKDPRFGPWRDTHAELYGPIVQQLQLVFAEDWHWGTEEVIVNALHWNPPYAPADKSGIIVPTGPGDTLETGALFFFSAISAAKSRVWIASPYFVPDTDVLTALKHAALRGVDVRILVPEVIDHKITWLAAFAYFDEVRETGVQILRYNHGFMHQKVVLVDDTMSAIGTTNMDNRSFRLNFEAMAVMFDPDTAAQVEAFLEEDFERSFRLEKTLAEQPRHIRVGAPIARLFSPIL